MTHLMNSSISSATTVGGKTLSFLTTEMYQLLVKVIVFVGLPIAAFGTAGNIINIMAYAKMGFGGSTNISLTAMAWSDLGVALTAICMEIITFVPTVREISFAQEVTFTLVSFPHLILARTSAVITAFISLDRLMCVLLPLKIKQTISPGRTFIFMVSIYALVILPMIVVYFRFPLGQRFFPQENRSLLGILPIKDETIETSYLIFQVYSSLIIPFSSFGIVTFCTILLSINLRRSKEWRDDNGVNKKQTSSKSETSVQNRMESKEKKQSKWWSPLQQSL